MASAPGSEDEGRQPGRRRDKPAADSGRDAYAWIAPCYDLLLLPWLGGMRRAAAGILSGRGVQSAVDLCCGTGAQCRELVRRGMIARGVDVSASMLRQARLKQGPYEEYFLEDAAATRFAESSFDAALLSFALHEKGRSEQEGLLAEARRIVRDGGLVLLIDFRPHSAVSPPFGWLVRAAERGMGRSHYRHFKAFLQSGALPDLLSGQGLATLETRLFTLLPAELRLAANGR